MLWLVSVAFSQLPPSCSDLTGAWCCAVSHLTQVATDLTLTASYGHGNGTVFSNGMGNDVITMDFYEGGDPQRLTGRVSKDCATIFWSNGVDWYRLTSTRTPTPTPSPLPGVHLDSKVGFWFGRKENEIIAIDSHTNSLVQWNGLWWWQRSPPITDGSAKFSTIGSIFALHSESVFVLDVTLQRVLWLNESSSPAVWQTASSTYSHPSDPLSSALSVTEYSRQGFYCSAITSSGTIYRHTADGWVKQDSTCQPRIEGSIQGVMAYEPIYVVARGGSESVSVLREGMCDTLTGVVPPAAGIVKHATGDSSSNIFASTSSGEIWSFSSLGQWERLANVSNWSGFFVAISPSEIFGINNTTGQIEQFNGDSVIPVTTGTTRLTQATIRTHRAGEGACGPRQVADPVFPGTSGVFVAASEVSVENQHMMFVILRPFADAAYELHIFHPSSNLEDIGTFSIVNSHKRSLHLKRALAPCSSPPTMLTQLDAASRFVVLSITCDDATVHVAVHFRRGKLVDMPSISMLRLENLAETSQRNLVAVASAMGGDPFVFVGRCRDVDKSMTSRGPLNSLTPSLDESTEVNWKDSTVIYQLNPKLFTSPFGSESGTIASLQDKLSYLHSLGITMIWLDGSNWADGRHYCNIWTQYATVHPGLLEPTLFPKERSQKGMVESLKRLTDAAHSLGIRVILDVTCHGVMSYSPLATTRSASPFSVVYRHPNSSEIRPHPDWFEAISWPDYTQVPQLKQGWVHTRMIDYDVEFYQPDLDQFWLDAHWQLVKQAGIDGFRLDIGGQLCAKFSLILQLRDMARKELNKELWVMPEGDVAGDYPYEAGVMDVSQDAFTSPIQDMASIDFSKLSRRYYTIQSSIHDRINYGMRGSAFAVGYGMIFTPFIPMWYMGDELNIPYVEAPRHTDDASLYSHTCNIVSEDHVKWLYAAQMRWEDGDEAFADLVGRTVKMRIKYPELTYFANRTSEANLVLVDSFSPSTLPTPYLRNMTGPVTTAVLVIGNPGQAVQSVTVTIPLDRCGFAPSTNTFHLVDLMSGKEEVLDRSALAQYQTSCDADNFRIIRIREVKRQTNK